MELRHLRYFVAVAEAENITRAATRLHISQPALSRQIKDLEEGLGLALFEHGARNVRLTEGGRLFLIEARAVLQRAGEAVQTAKAIASGRREVIHVGFAPSLTVQILPAALRRFQETNPGVRVELHDLSSQEMIDELQGRKLDVALMVHATPKVMRKLIFHELARFRVCVAVHPAHPLARLRKVSLGQIVKERFIAYSATGYPEYHSWLAELFKKCDGPPQIAEEHESSTSLIASVEAGRGVALVQQGFECLSGPRLKVRPLEPPPREFIVGLSCRRELHPGSVERFIEATIAACDHRSPHHLR
jgi:DNA-binding transcriptional LysR family regulator